MASAAPVTDSGIVIHEYHKAAQPRDWLRDLPVRALDSASSAPDSVALLDLADCMGLDHPASSPCLLAGFVKVSAGSSLETQAVASSQAFFVVRGGGSTAMEWPEGSAMGEPRVVSWGAGDLFVVPAGAKCSHRADDGDRLPVVPGGAAAAGGAAGSAVLYWVHDGPLLEYLGVAPARPRFEPALYPWARLAAEVERIRHEPGAEHRNRLGILLSASGPGWAERTKTLTPTLWSLLNVIPAGDVQPPHRHNSVALDLAVSAPAAGGVYTMMSPTLGEDGSLVDPVRVEWRAGAAFVTPPGWWHSHHNDTEEDAWVLPVQDAGLHTHLQTLRIQFAPRPHA